LTKERWSQFWAKLDQYGFPVEPWLQQLLSTKGRTHLKQAIKLDSEYLEDAKNDTDFDKIRHDSRFINLINSQNQNLQWWNPPYT
jgi:hypothetical protein